MTKKIFFRWLKLVIIIYCAIGIAFYYLQERILFHPQALSKDAKYNFSHPYTELNIPYDHETNLNIVEFKVPDSSVKGVVLYFHGNRNNISWYEKYVTNFTKRNYEVWMVDYPGFGKSTGKFTEQKVYEYALQLYILARARFKPSGIVIYGKSLGSCIASQLASVRDCKYLILETPCYSMTSLVSHYFPVYPVNQMLHYHFPNNEFLKTVTAPVIIFHGTEDWMVPYRNALRLEEVLKPHDEFVTIQGGSHNDLNDFPVFHQKLDSLLK
jgi:pimeloyl-ACP methyl ester carboxylesterase